MQRDIHNYQPEYGEEYNYASVFEDEYSEMGARADGGMQYNAMDAAKNVMSSFLANGDLSIMLSKNRLHMRVDASMDNLFKGINHNTIESELQGFINEIQGF